MTSKPHARFEPTRHLDSLTRDVSPETRATLSELASLIMSTIPDATPKLNLGWGSLNFSHPRVGYFCGLFPVEDRIDVAFEFGVLLADPDGILDRGRASKQVRYVRIRPAERIPRAALRRLLRQAVSLPEERSARIALARSGAQPLVTKPRTRRPNS